jgi:hypothetical protein
MVQPKGLPHLPGHLPPGRVGAHTFWLGRISLICLRQIKEINTESFPCLLDLPLFFGLGQEMKEWINQAVIDGRALLFVTEGEETGYPVKEK